MIEVKPKYLKSILSRIETETDYKLDDHHRNLKAKSPVPVYAVPVNPSNFDGTEYGQMRKIAYPRVQRMSDFGNDILVTIGKQPSIEGIRIKNHNVIGNLVRCAWHASGGNVTRGRMIVNAFMNDPKTYRSILNRAIAPYKVDYNTSSIEIVWRKNEIGYRLTLRSGTDTTYQFESNMADWSRIARGRRVSPIKIRKLGKAYSLTRHLPDPNGRQTAAAYMDALRDNPHGWYITDHNNYDALSSDMIKKMSEKIPVGNLSLARLVEGTGKAQKTVEYVPMPDLGSRLAKLITFFYHEVPYELGEEVPMPILYLAQAVAADRLGVLPADVDVIYNNEGGITMNVANLYLRLDFSTPDEDADKKMSVMQRKWTESE